MLTRPHPIVCKDRRPAGIAVVAAASLMLAACSSLGGGLFGGSTETVDLPDGVDPEPPKVQTRLDSGSAIPVLVNDKPITRFDIDQRQKLMRLGGAGSTRQAAIDELIDEQIQLNEAERLSFRAPQTRIDAAYAQLAGNLKLSPSQMDQALRQEGIQPEALKKRLRAQITWGALVDRRVRQEASQPSRSDLAAELLGQAGGEAITLQEYFLQQIIFVVPTGSPDSRYTQRRNEANAFRQRYAGCESALAQARELREVVVKDLGRRPVNRLTGPQGEAIKGTSAGSATQPRRVDEGIELIGVCSIREVQSTAAAEAELSNKYRLAQAEGLGADYLKELREAAIIEYR